uniref:Uncharacterized protein n=2 Tax=Meloidogyne TaxID=189290 RepID=A0A915NHY7_9BILA
MLRVIAILMMIIVLINGDCEDMNCKYFCEECELSHPPSCIFGHVPCYKEGCCPKLDEIAARLTTVKSTRSTQKEEILC